MDNNKPPRRRNQRTLELPDGERTTAGKRNPKRGLDSDHAPRTEGEHDQPANRLGAETNTHSKGTRRLPARTTTPSSTSRDSIPRANVLLQPQTPTHAKPPRSERAPQETSRSSLFSDRLHRRCHQRLPSRRTQQLETHLERPTAEDARQGNRRST